MVGAGDGWSIKGWEGRGRGGGGDQRLVERVWFPVEFGRRGSLKRNQKGHRKVFS